MKKIAFWILLLGSVYLCAVLNAGITVGPPPPTGSGGGGGSGSNNVAVPVPGQLIAVTNSGVITLSLNGLLTTNLQNATYWINSGGATANFAQLSGLPTATAKGQILVTYDPSLGANVGGIMLVSGNDLSWRTRMQNGGWSIFDYQVGDADGLSVITTNGIDNCISVRSLDTTHYSAMRFMSSAGGEQGAIGYGNSTAPFYVANLYFESFGLANPIMFTGNGKIQWGMENTTGDFVMTDRTSANYDSTHVNARMNSSGIMSKYNNQITTGPGLSAINGSYNGVGVSASVASTLVYTNTTGGYVTLSLHGIDTVTTAATTGVLTCTATWTNELGQQTFTPVSAVSTATQATRPFAVTEITVSNTTAVTIFTTQVNTSGTAIHTLRWSVHQWQ